MGLRLNIGCGQRHRAGYTTIDIKAKYKPDIVGDFRTMEFEDVDLILAEHLLEHFGRDEGIDILKLWYKWLNPGGHLHIETPDFEEICKDFSKNKYWMARHAYGSQDERGRDIVETAEWAYHRDAWYEEKFRKVLPDIGFKVLGFKRNHTRIILPNIKVLAQK